MKMQYTKRWSMVCAFELSYLIDQIPHTCIVAMPLEVLNEILKSSCGYLLTVKLKANIYM